MRDIVICTILLSTFLPAFANAGIASRNGLTIDFTDPNDAKAKANWSDPNHIGITNEGLGWDGQKNASRDVWIQTTELSIGLSWRPARSAYITVQLEHAVQEVTLENGKTIHPSAGTVFVRYSPDAKHFSSWQAMQLENTQNKQKEQYEFKTFVQIPEKNRIEYLKYHKQYQRLDVPWKSDEEALVKWIVEHDPNFFENPPPFIGYLQFLYEGWICGGQRIQRFHANADWVIGGKHLPPKDPNYSSRGRMPWRYRPPVGHELKRDGITAKIGLDSTDIRFKKDFSVPIIIENHSDKSIQIDTSPDEVIKPPSESSGGQYRERGSRCVLTVTQDSNDRIGFFSTADMKVKPQNKGRNSFTIKPGKTHTLKFIISPWGPGYSAIPSTAVPGPAKIKGELRILIDGQQLNVPLETVGINFVN